MEVLLRMVDQATMETVAGATQGASGADSVSGGTNPAQPTLILGAQYVRSVSFQAIDSARLHTRPPVRPNTRMAIDVTARQILENQPDFEVDLVMRCEGIGEEPVEGGDAPRLFETVITYSGLFTLRNVTTESFEPLLLVEAPRQIFPAARNYLADITREAGFMPVILPQIDFLALWQSRRAAGQVAR